MRGRKRRATAYELVYTNGVEELRQYEYGSMREVQRLARDLNRWARSTFRMNRWKYCARAYRGAEVEV